MEHDKAGMQQMRIAVFTKKTSTQLHSAGCHHAQHNAIPTHLEHKQKRQLLQEDTMAVLFSYASTHCNPVNAGQACPT
jgi:hypothetical protein